MNKESALTADFGGQYNQLIARRVRECGVCCEVHPHTLGINGIKEMNPKGIILIDGPNSVYKEDSPLCDKALFGAGIPVLRICYGSQLVAHVLGGKAATAPVGEYGKTKVDVNIDSKIFDGVSTFTICWVSHTDYVEKAPEGFKTVANIPVCPIVAMECPGKKLYAVQFHLEVMYTQERVEMMSNFLYNVCECSGDWRMGSFVERTIQKVREKVGNGKVLYALSDGVSSSIAAVLLSKAVGSQLTYVFVNHGLLRKDEGDEVEEVFRPNGQYGPNLVRVDAQKRFYEKLKGIEEPEQKRKIIGEGFIRVFEEETRETGTVNFLVQGTTYPDVVESDLGKSAIMKSRHNAGGLPDYVNFKEVIGPLRLLFKDEVREVGLEPGTPEKLVYRQSFPEPDSGIRIIGEVTAEKVGIVQDANAIYREEVANAGVDKELNQYFAALTNMRSIEAMGDERTYDYAVVLRVVTTSDFMTAESAGLPWEVLGKVTTRIANEVEDTNRVMYDYTGGPPATIEFE